MTLRDTGEHVRVEVWSAIAAAYRLRSRKSGLLFATDAEVEDVPVHPDEQRGKHWSRCRATGCGAPLTWGLAICARCQAPTCTCGRCECIRPSTVTGTPRRKMARKQAEPRRRSRG